MNLWRKTLPPPASSESLRSLRETSSASREGPYPVWVAASHPRSRPLLHMALFVLTLVSMTAAGAMQQGVNPFHDVGRLVHLVEGIPFAATLLCILTVHEFGHYFAARRWKVKASLPYFLPLPYVSFLGTLGAVIRLRSPIPHKRALLDIGASGPLAGFVVAVAACVIGLPQSRIVTPEYFYQTPFNPTEPIVVGAPILFAGLSELLMPAVDASQLVLLSPVAFAGWVGLFITAFNLFPVGQLDGGHIVYALFGRWHREVGRVTFGVLLGLGVYGILSLVWDLPQGWPGWLGLAFFLSLFGKEHPAPYYPYVPLDEGRRRIGWLCLFVFAICFTPVPFST